MDEDWRSSARVGGVGIRPIAAKSLSCSGVSLSRKVKNQRRESVRLRSLTAFRELAGASETKARKGKKLQQLHDSVLYLV